MYNENFYNYPTLYKKNDSLIVKYKTGSFIYEPFRNDIEIQINEIIDDNFNVKVFYDKIIILTFKEDDLFYNFNTIIKIVNKFDNYTIFIKYKDLKLLGDLFESCNKQVSYIIDNAYNKVICIKKQTKKK